MGETLRRRHVARFHRPKSLLEQTTSQRLATFRRAVLPLAISDGLTRTRRLADPGQWASPIDQAARKIAGQYALEVIPGKLVWELRPPVRRDKGDAVRRVVAESGARDVVVVGDDLGDLPAFSAVAQLAGQGHKGLRVAVRAEEAPPQLLAEADLIIEGPAGVLDFLQQLAA